jgi:protein-S-isoprenylcysteine O-methyltransferase Ste14
LDNEAIINYNFPLTIIHYVLTGGSLLMLLWTFFVDYDSFSFIGIRQILNFKKIKEKHPIELKKHGLLGIVRHPMYLATIIFLWAQTTTLAHIFVNIIFTIYIIIGTKLEEKKLILEFGDEYIKYQQEVPMMVPFWRKKRIRY